MKKNVKNILIEGSASLSPIAFLLSGIFFGSLDSESNRTYLVTLIIVILFLFTVRVFILILQKSRRAAFLQFYQWMFEGSIVSAFSGFQQSHPVYCAVLLLLSILLLLSLFLIVFSKLFG